MGGLLTCGRGRTRIQEVESALPNRRTTTISEIRQQTGGKRSISVGLRRNGSGIERRPLANVLTALGSQSDAQNKRNKQKRKETSGQRGGGRSRRVPAKGNASYRIWCKGAAADASACPHVMPTRRCASDRRIEAPPAAGFAPRRSEARDACRCLRDASGGRGGESEGRQLSEGGQEGWQHVGDPLGLRKR